MCVSGGESTAPISPSGAPAAPIPFEPAPAPQPVPSAPSPSPASEFPSWAPPPPIQTAPAGTAARLAQLAARFAAIARPAVPLLLRGANILFLITLPGDTPAHFPAPPDDRGERNMPGAQGPGGIYRMPAATDRAGGASGTRMELPGAARKGIPMRDPTVGGAATAMIVNPAAGGAATRSKGLGEADTEEDVKGVFLRYPWLWEGRDRLRELIVHKTAVSGPTQGHTARRMLEVIAFRDLAIFDRVLGQHFPQLVQQPNLALRIIDEDQPSRNLWPFILELRRHYFGLDFIDPNDLARLSGEGIRPGLIPSDELRGIQDWLMNNANYPQVLTFWPSNWNWLIARARHPRLFGYSRSTPQYAYAAFTDTATAEPPFAENDNTMRRQGITLAPMRRPATLDGLQAWEYGPSAAGLRNWVRPDIWSRDFPGLNALAFPNPAAFEAQLQGFWENVTSRFPSHRRLPIEVTLIIEPPKETTAGLNGHEEAILRTITSPASVTRARRIRIVSTSWPGRTPWKVEEFVRVPAGEVTEAMDVAAKFGDVAIIRAASIPVGRRT